MRYVDKFIIGVLLMVVGILVIGSGSELGEITTTQTTDVYTDYWSENGTLDNMTETSEGHLVLDDVSTRGSWTGNSRDNSVTNIIYTIDNLESQGTVEKNANITFNGRINGGIAYSETWQLENDGSYTLNPNTSEDFDSYNLEVTMETSSEGNSPVLESLRSSKTISTSDEVRSQVGLIIGLMLMLFGIYAIFKEF